MSDRARIDTPNGKLVFARDISYATKNEHKFFCSNSKCNAEMFLKCCGAYNAHFATMPHAKHAFLYCQPQVYEYKCDPVSEAKFSLEDAISTICRKQDNNIHHQQLLAPSPAAKKGTVGSGHALPPHTTLQLHAACVAHGINGMIGTVPVKNLFLCEQNAWDYASRLNGFCIVEAKYDKKEFGQPIIFGTFKVNSKIVLRLRCDLESKNLENEFKARIRKIPVEERKRWPMVIAAEWHQTASSTLYECDIRKSSQIIFR